MAVYRVASIPSNYYENDVAPGEIDEDPPEGELDPEATAPYEVSVSGAYHQRITETLCDAFELAMSR